MKILSFLAPFLSKIKISGIFNFLSVKYLGKGLSFLKTWDITVNYYWSCGLSNLLFRFFRYRLGHHDNRQTKKTSKLDNTFFWKLTPKKVFVESLKVFDPPTTKWWSLTFFAKLNGNHIFMANFSKLCEHQTFVLIELHNLSKG